MVVRRALVYLPALLVLAVEALVIWPVPVHVGDWFQFWYVGHIMAAGQSPLETASWRDAVYGYPDIIDGAVANARREIATVPETPIVYPPWVYPPWTGAIFIPFGVLPLVVGVVLLHIVLVVVGIAAAVWLVSRLDLPAPARALALAIAVALEPWVLATRTGHFSAVLLAGAILVAIALERGTVLPLVAGAVLLSLKPHVAAGFALLVLVVLLRRRSWRQVAVTTAVLGAITAVFYLRYPPPATTASALLSRVATDDVASTYALADFYSPGHGTIVGAGALAIVAVVAWWVVQRATRYGALTFVAAALCISLAISPYVHTYDHLLLAPAFLLPLAITAHLPGPRRLLMGSAVVVGALVVPWFAYFADVHGRQAPSAIAPFLAVLLLAAATVLARSEARSRLAPVTV